MNTKVRYFILICLLLQGSLSIAQNHFGILTNSRHSAQFAVNANPIINTQFDYLFKFKEKKIAKNPFGIGASIGLPPFAQKEGFDLNYSFGLSSIISISKKFKMLATTNLNFYHISDLSASYFSYGPQIDFFPGFYADKWVFTTHFSFDYRPFVYIKHKDFSKQAYEGLYPSVSGEYLYPKDGWFGQHHHFGNYGVAIVYYTDKFNVNFTIDYSCPLTELGFKIIPELGMLPFSTTIGFNYNFH